MKYRKIKKDHHFGWKFVFTGISSFTCYTLGNYYCLIGCQMTAKVTRNRIMTG